MDHLRKAGGDPDERSEGAHPHAPILSALIIAGIQTGEFRRMPVRAATDLMYSLVEASIFRIVVLGKPDAASLKESGRLMIEGMKPAGRSS